MNLEKIKERIIEQGPDKVMVSPHEAADTERARRMGIGWDVVFIRVDGMTLGAPDKYRHDAERSWREFWVAYLAKPDMEIIRY